MTRLKEEHGIALPVAVMVLGIAITLTGFIITSAVSSTRGSVKDTQSKRAIQAADAGLQMGRGRANLLGLATGAVPCVTINASGSLQAVSADVSLPAWCPPVTETLADGSTYSYRVSSGAAATVRTIVSTGTSGTVSRRVATTLTATVAGTPLFGLYGITSNQSLIFQNGARVTSNVRSNGSISLTGGAYMCGRLTTSTGFSVLGIGFNGVSLCGTATRDTAPPFTLADVDVGTAPTTNSNARICTTDACSGVQYNTSFRWDAAKRDLRVVNNAQVTLAGTAPYYFCNLDIENGSKIIIPSSATVKIYIGSPESCAAANGSSLLSGLSSWGKFTQVSGAMMDNQSHDPTHLQVNVAGSSNVLVDDEVKFDNQNGQTEYFTMYAPKSKVTMVNNPQVVGAVAGDQVVMDGGGSVASSDAVATLGTSGSTGYLQGDYRECLTGQGSAVDAGCSVNPTG